MELMTPMYAIVANVLIHLIYKAPFQKFLRAPSWDTMAAKYTLPKENASHTDLCAETAEMLRILGERVIKVKINPAFV